MLISFKIYIFFPFDIPLELRRKTLVWEKLIFSSLTEAFSISQLNCTPIGSCSAIKSNQWLGRASGYIRGHFTAASQISSLKRRRFFLADSSLMPRFAVEMPQQSDWTSCSTQLALPGLSPAAIRRRSKRASQKSKLTVIPAARSSPVAHSLETGPPLSSERHAVASTARVTGPACVAAQREPFDLPERVLNTMAEARAPSTRCLYALKWSISSDVSVVLSFLQEMLDKQRSSSTIKVYTAAIAAFHAPIAGRSVGRDSAVVQFIQGARKLNPPRPRTVPPWDLPTVLRAFRGPPFEPLQYSSLRSLSFKTALLLALESV